MGHINSFDVELPDKVELDIYSIKPEPTGDSEWVAGNRYRKILEDKVGGKGRYVGKESVIAVVGSQDKVDSINTSDGTFLNYEYTEAEEPKNRRWTLRKALTESLEWYIYSNYDRYWYDSTDYAIYDEGKKEKVGDKIVYQGSKARIHYYDGFQLCMDPKIKTVGRSTLSSLINSEGVEKSKSEYIGEKFIQSGSRKKTCTVQAIYDELTVSDEPPIDRFDEPVKEYIETREGKKYSEKVSDDEPLVLVSYRGSGRYPAAPSLLIHSPSTEQNRKTTDIATPEPSKRWEITQEFRDVIGDYIPIYNLKARVDNEPIELNDSFLYPSLSFSDDKVLEMGEKNEAGSGGVHPGNWGEIKKDYLREFGPKKSYKDVFDIVILHGSDTEKQATDAYNKIKNKAAKYGVSLTDSPGKVNYDNKDELTEWEKYGSADGVLSFLQEGRDLYFDLIDASNGIPNQHLTQEEYEKADTYMDDMIFNLTMGLISKLGVVPYELNDDLGSDAYIGLDVDSGTVDVAASVLASGKGGKIIDHTKKQLPNSSPAEIDEGNLRKLLEEKLKSGIENGHIDSLESLVILRNGRFEKSEEEEMEKVMSDLKKEPKVSSDLNWYCVEVRNSKHYRIYDSKHWKGDTGMYRELDYRTLLLLTRTEGSQGTPQPFICKMKKWDGWFDIDEIGKDLFYLSNLNWGSPTMAIKDPLPLHLSKELTSKLSECRKMDYLPF